MAKPPFVVRLLLRFSEPPTQASLFHYLKDREAERIRLKDLLGDIAASFRSPAFIPSVLGNPDDLIDNRVRLRTRRMEAGLFSVLVHVSILLLAVLLVRSGPVSVPIKEVTVSLNTPFFDLPFAGQNSGGGGGGGGRGEQSPPAHGRIPGASRIQLLAPDPTEPRPLVPPDHLSAEQSIVSPIEIPQDPSLPIGDPTAPPSISRSHGPGTRDGIGTGDGTGLGPGNGPGAGRGKNGGFGGGDDGTVGRGDGVYRMPVAGLVYPEILSDPKPAYTEEARKSRVEGIVLIQAIVRKDGSVDSLKVIRGLGHGLDESAIHTIATRWRFKPGRFNGMPVDVQANIEVSFRLY